MHAACVYGHLGCVWGASIWAAWKVSCEYGHFAICMCFYIRRGMCATNMDTLAMCTAVCAPCLIGSERLTCFLYVCGRIRRGFAAFI